MNKQSSLRFYQANRLVSKTHPAGAITLLHHAFLPLAQIEAGSAGGSLLSGDQQNSILQLSSASQRANLNYGPYGQKPLEQAPPSLLGFNGEPCEHLTGHYLLGNGHRAFNPTLMRFNSADKLSPFGKGGLNCYMYCEGDPVNFSDPTGRLRGLTGVLRRAFKLATGGGSVAMLKEKSEQIAEFGQTIKHSVVEGPWEISDASPARQLINDNVVINGQPFNLGLLITNGVLASNLNGSLGYNQAHVYVADSRMDWSNSFKFFRSALRWGRKAWLYGRADAAAGMFLNGFSAFLSSGIDHANRMNGRAVQLTPDPLSIRQ